VTPRSPLEPRTKPFRVRTSSDIDVETGSVWLRLEEGALYLDGAGICSEVVPRGSAMDNFLGARLVGAVDSRAPLGLGGMALPGTLPLFVVHGPSGAPKLLRASKVLSVIAGSSCEETGRHTAIDESLVELAVDLDASEDDRPTLRNLSDAV
jgi:hypothetical protein